MNCIPESWPGSTHSLSKTSGRMCRTRCYCARKLICMPKSELSRKMSHLLLVNSGWVPWSQNLTKWAVPTTTLTIENFAWIPTNPRRRGPSRAWRTPGSVLGKCCGETGIKLQLLRNWMRQTQFLSSLPAMEIQTSKNTLLVRSWLCTTPEQNVHFCFHRTMWVTSGNVFLLLPTRSSPASQQWTLKLTMKSNRSIRENSMQLLIGWSSSARTFAEHGVLVLASLCNVAGLQTYIWAWPKDQRRFPWKESLSSV